MKFKLQALNQLKHEPLKKPSNKEIAVYKRPLRGSQKSFAEYDDFESRLRNMSAEDSFKISDY